MLPLSPMRVLYHDAIGADVRTDSTKIAEAEQAIITRARELYSEHGTEVDVERDALDDALYALHALRSTVTLGTAA